MLLIILFKLFFHAPGDDYYVSYVRGNVFFAANNRPVVVGEKLHLQDQLIFGDPTNFVAVINPEKGRFIINRIKTLPATRLNGVLLAISENIVPVTLPQTLAGRGSINSLDDLRLFFSQLSQTQKSATPRLMLADTLKIILSAANFTDRVNQYFFLRYRYAGETVNKKLDYQVNGDILQLVLDRRIYQVDGQPVQHGQLSDIQLFFYDSQLKQTQMISPLDISDVKPEDVVREINVLFTNLWLFYKANPGKKEYINNVIRQIITDEYGFADSRQLNLMIRSVEQ